MRHAEIPAGHADQASGLRRLLAPHPARLFALTGSDPDHLAVLADALAGALQRAWGRVLLLDLSNGALAAAAGRPGRYELMHVMDRCKSVKQVLFDAPSGAQVLPAARAVRALAGEPDGAARFAGLLSGAALAPQMTLALVPPEQLAALAGLAGVPQVLLALTRGSARELTDAYSVLKRVRALGAIAYVVVEGLRADAAEATLARLRETAQMFLGGAPNVLGRLAGRADAARPAHAQRSQGARPLDVDALAHAMLAWPLPQPVRSLRRVAARTFATA